MSAPDPRHNLEYELGNIGSVAACLAALSMDCRDSEPALVKAIDYLGYMLRLQQKAAYDAFEALLPALAESGPKPTDQTIATGGAA